MFKIRTSTHYFNKICNINKQLALSNFIDEYRSVTQFVIDYLWNNEIEYNDKIFNIQQNLLNCPQFISTTGLNIDSTLSERAIKCAATQACSIVRGTIEKKKKRLYVLDKLKTEGKDTTKLQEKIDKTPINKPIVPQDFKCELNSICCDFIETKNSFDGFIQLKSIGKKYGKIRIPIKFHRQSNKWKNQGVLKPSFIISKKYINMRWEVDFPEKKQSGKTIGADSGVITCLTLSDGQVTKKCPHGHDLHSINKKLCGRKYGSKGFERTQNHRENYVNWSLNQLNLNDIQQINIEEIYDIGRGQNKGKFLKHWKNTIIRDKLISIGEESGVQIHFQSSIYRSQRCSSCGYVNKLNRKGKIFLCRNCGFTDDADLNSSLNHEIYIPEIEFNLLPLKLNKAGFYWLPEGIFNLKGEELTVPDAGERVILH